MHYLTQKLVKQYSVIKMVFLRRYGYDVDGNEEADKVLMQAFNLEKRLIEVKPRTVFVSENLECPKHLIDEFSLIKTKIEEGENINGYQTLKVDKLNKHDYLLYDWGIHHLHFDDFHHKDFNRKKRSQELLFIYFENDSAYLIDVKNHKSFNDKDLLNIIDENWSQLLEKHLVKGALGLETSYSETDTSMLRKACINTFTELKSKKTLTSLGGGIVTSGDSLEASMKLNDFYHFFEDIVRYVLDSENGIINSPFKFQSEIRLGVDEYERIFICDELSTEVVPMEIIGREAQRYAMHIIE